MPIKAISSTKAKNHFGGILDDIAQNNTRYVIKRHGMPQAIMLSLPDFEQILEDDQKQHTIEKVLRELKPEYDLGETILQE
jgi:PHD/YefM family antitoxin component YafN of YafNO toxin-antitoxin module